MRRGTMGSDGDAKNEQLTLVLSLRATAAGRTPQRQYRTAGLFAGIGGIELGLHRAGHETALLCEIDPAAQAVLEARFPAVRLHGDITTLRSLPKETDLLVAGFPCQDLSQAGKTAGIEGSRSGLVGEVFRLLRRKRVEAVLLENVPFMLQLSKGRALEVIVSSLEALGYRWAYRVVDSRSFGVPQRRERVYLLAMRSGDPREILLSEDVGPPAAPVDPTRVACGFYWTEGVRGLGWAVDAVPTLKGGSTIGIPSPPAIVMPGGTIVKPDIRDAERLQGFAVDWTLPATVVVKPGGRWKLVGNAVTVGAAEWIGRRLAAPLQYEPTFDVPLHNGDRWPRAAWNMGQGRFRAARSAWPSHEDRPALAEFLMFEPQMLSEKATAGFLARTRTSSLRFPPGFIAAVERHLEGIRTRLSA